MRTRSGAARAMELSRRHALLSVAVAVGLGTATANAQVGPNINRNVRPLVAISFQNPFPAGDPLALGIFDTGGTSLFIPAETNSRVGIGVAATNGGANPDLTNYGVVGNPTDLTVGGWLGGAYGGPEIQSTAAAPRNGPAHIFGTDSLRFRTQPFARTGIAPSLTYFNAVAAAFSEPNVGAGFYNGDGNTQAPLVAGVDPINASYLPFASGNVLNPPPNNLQPPSIPLDQMTSSISFFDPNSIRVPTAALNANPGFLSVISLTPLDPTTGLAAASFTRFTDAGNNNATRGMRPRVTINAGNNIFDVPVTNGNYIADTGAPTTGAPGPNSLLGTDALNGFGQYWDFQRQQLLLFGPTNAADRALLGPGMLMTVDRNAGGLTRTGVNQMNQFGPPPVLNAMGSAGGGADGTPTIPPAVLPQQASSFFRTNMTHSNAAYITGTQALGLLGNNNDQLDGASMGADGIDRQCTLWFSVDGNSFGITGAVPQQTALGQQMGDVFESQTGQPVLPIGPGFNSLRFNQDVMGLGANVGPTTPAAGRGNQDNLRDFDLQTDRGYVGAGAANVMRNFDPSINAPGDNRNPGGGVAGAPGVRGDVYGTNFDTYFSLDVASPGLGGASPADVLVNNAGGAGKHVFATSLSEGLIPADDIDAISLQRAGSPLQGPLNSGTQRTSSVTMLTPFFDANPQGVFDTIDPFAIPGAMADLMLFSLAPGSPSLGIFDPFLGRPLSPADIFITDFDGTFALYATAESLGLAPIDNIDGLDSTPVPEPVGGLALAALAAMGTRRRRRG